MNKRASIIISDVHIGAGRLDDCDQDLESNLCDFLKMLSDRDDSIELIINGDFLDFVQAPPWKGADLSGIKRQDSSLSHLGALGQQTGCNSSGACRGFQVIRQLSHRQR